MFSKKIFKPKTCIYCESGLSNCFHFIFFAFRSVLVTDPNLVHQMGTEENEGVLRPIGNWLNVQAHVLSLGLADLQNQAGPVRLCIQLLYGTAEGVKPREVRSLDQICTAGQRWS